MNYATDFKSVRGAVSAAEWQTRVDLAACYRLMDCYGMTDLIYNHITSRIPGTDDHLLINLYGLLYKEITASSLAKITLEEIMARYQWPRIDVLKLDCEGSEFSILEHCDLSRIGTIFLESHGAARFRELLARKFPAELWDIGHMSQGGEGGNFENWHLVNRRFSRGESLLTAPGLPSG
jgi:hypothetical protein